MKTRRRTIYGLSRDCVSAYAFVLHPSAHQHSPDFTQNHTEYQGFRARIRATAKRAMRFLADMGVSLRVVDWLCADGHDVTHLRTEGLQRLPNGDIFAKADREKRTVLTFDLDFGEIVASAKQTKPSVIIFRLHNTRSEFVIQRLNSVLLGSASILGEGAVIIVEDSRYRIRRLPIGG